MALEVKSPALREDNPFSIGTLFIFDEGDYVLDAPTLDIPRSPKDKYYTVKKGDDLWNIAWQAYGSSKWYWVIMFANGIDFGMELRPGQTLTIPDLPTVQLLL